jgi:CMP/dCMP kinase
VVIAIDGPAGAGKSTVARALAQRLGFGYLDSGAMYRCVGLLALERPHAAPSALAQATRIELGADGTRSGGRTGGAVLLDGRDVSRAIRLPEVSDAASRVAADPAVREALKIKQRALLASGDWIAEGRDIATVVAPDADLKIHLTAGAAERARRRAADLGSDPATVLAEQALRDQRDSTLERSTLRPAPGAVELDTTGLSIEQVVERIVRLLPASRLG